MLWVSLLRVPHLGSRSAWLFSVGPCYRISGGVPGLRSLFSKALVGGSLVSALLVSAL